MRDHQIRRAHTNSHRRERQPPRLAGAHCGSHSVAAATARAALAPAHHAQDVPLAAAIERIRSSEAWEARPDPETKYVKAGGGRDLAALVAARIGAAGLLARR